MDMKERMLAGLPYKAWLDGLPEERLRAQKAVYEINNMPPERFSEIADILKGLFAKRPLRIFKNLQDKTYKEIKP